MRRIIRSVGRVHREPRHGCVKQPEVDPVHRPGTRGVHGGVAGVYSVESCLEGHEYHGRAWQH
jgi:hypothetical protein